MRLTYCEQMYAWFCSVFLAFTTSSESNLCIGRMKDGRYNHQNIKEHAQRPCSSLLSVNQHTDLATLFLSNHQPNMECGQANILEQVTDPDKMTCKCRHTYGGNQSENVIIVENKSSVHILELVMLVTNYDLHMQAHITSCTGKSNLLYSK